MIAEDPGIALTSGCITALSIGIAASLSQCSVSCAPFVSTYIMGSRDSAAGGFRSYMVFSAGRVFMCAISGLGAGYMGDTLMGMLPNQKYGSIIWSGMMMLIGLLMLMLPTRAGKRPEFEACWPRLLWDRFIINPTAHLFAMGMAFAAIPCPPMVAMLLYSMNMPSIIHGGMIMALFGIATAVCPLAIVCVLAGWFSKRIKTRAPQYRSMFQRVSGAILILLGGSSAVLWRG